MQRRPVLEIGPFYSIIVRIGESGDLWCIKEGIEPWKSQRWLFTYHVQVSVSLCSLSSSILFCFYCYYYFYYYYYYVCLLVKGLL